MNNRQANTLMALIIALIVTQIMCTGLLLSGQERLRSIIKPMQPLPSQEIHSYWRSGAEITEQSALLEAQQRAKISQQLALLEAQQELADARRQIADEKSENNRRIEKQYSDLAARLLDVKLQQMRYEASAAEINRDLARQGEQLSGTIPIPLAR